MILTSLEVDVKTFEARTGWAIKSEGACKGEVCVPLSAGASTAGKINARVVSEWLGMPLIHEPEAGLWCLGPEALGRALTTARAPELTLPDYQGSQFHLSSLRGQKVLIVTWASW